MDIKKLAPWNWFKKEEEDAGKTIPVKHSSSHESGYPVRSSIHQLRQDIDRMFDNMISGFGASPFGLDSLFFPRTADGILKPNMNISSTDTEYTITAEVPGVDETDVRLELSNDTLTIRGEKKQEKEEKSQNFYRMERSYGSFQRVLSLPEDADQDNIRATFKKGVLTICVPRNALPKSESKRIEIRSGE